MKILAPLQLKKELNALGGDSEVLFQSSKSSEREEKRETVSSGSKKFKQN